MGVNPASQRELFVEVLSGTTEMKREYEPKSSGPRSSHSGTPVQLIEYRQTKKCPRRKTQSRARAALTLLRKYSVSWTASESSWHPSRLDQPRAGTPQRNRPPVHFGYNCHGACICLCPCYCRDRDREQPTKVPGTVEGKTPETTSAQPYSWFHSLRRTRRKLQNVSGLPSRGELDIRSTLITNFGENRVKMLLFATVATICNHGQIRSDDGWRSNSTGGWLGQLRLEDRRLRPHRPANLLTGQCDRFWREETPRPSLPSDACSRANTLCYQ